jgi:hypothetical protein
MRVPEERKVAVKKVESAMKVEHVNPEAANQKPRVVMKNGKLVMINPTIQPRLPQANTQVAVPRQQSKKTSYSFLKPSKQQKALRWNEDDQLKFYDALRTFGEDIEQIYILVFSREARQRYHNPDIDFSERSQVQLKNKYKKDEHAINKHLSREGEASIDWFEQTYNISISHFEEASKKRRKAEIHSDSEAEEEPSSVQNASAGLISATGLQEK